MGWESFICFSLHKEKNEKKQCDLNRLIDNILQLPRFFITSFLTFDGLNTHLLHCVRTRLSSLSND